jgi:hypothetical protein
VDAVLVAADDAAALASACIALLGSPARRQQLSAAASARARAERGAPAMVRLYEGLYLDVVSADRARAGGREAARAAALPPPVTGSSLGGRP